MHKTLMVLFFLLGLICIAAAQKNPSAAAVNLNFSKTNIYRLVYSKGIVDDSLLWVKMGQDLDKQGQMDTAALKLWLPANFKVYGIDASRIKQISFFQEKQYKDCATCEAECKGACAKGAGTNCICFFKGGAIQTTERSAKPEKQRTVIFLSANPIGESAAIQAAATTVKSSKSNSSD